MTKAASLLADRLTDGMSGSILFGGTTERKTEWGCADLPSSKASKVF
jgi:hypothetical protein